MKDHEIAALVNELRDIALQFHDHQSLRERIASALVPALKESQPQDEARPWQFMAEDDPYKRLTEYKTKSIIDRDGFRVSGYILNKGTEMCLSYGSAIRWMNAQELFNVMHCISRFPRTAHGVREFIGHNYVSVKYGHEDHAPHDNDLYVLTAHDLLSSFQDWSES